MTEPTIKAKLVLDTGSGGISGAMNSGSSTSSGGNGIAGALMSKLTIPLTDVLGGILSGINKLVQASPVLAATMKEFHMGMRMMLMPIGETISTLLRPWIMKFNRVAFQFYDDYINGGLWDALINGIKNAFGTGSEGVANGIMAGATLVVGAAILKAGIGSVLGMIGSALGLGTVASAGGGLSLAIPAALILSGALLGDALIGGGEGKIIGIVAALLGLGTALAIGGGTVVAIATMLTLIGSAKIADELSGGDEGAATIGFIAGALGLGTVLIAGGGLAVAIPVALALGAVAGLAGAAYEETEQKLKTSREKSPEMRTPGEAFGTGYEGTIIPEGAQTAMKEWEQGISDTLSGAKDLKDYFINQLLLTPDAYAESLIMANEEKIKPTFMDLGNQIDGNVTKVKNLRAHVEGLPDIERTITYKVRYVR
jgi:hypothetical protein